MKKTIANEIQEMLNSGATMVESNKFENADGTPMKVRSMEGLNDPLEVGDKVTVPEDFKVIAVDINGNKCPCTIAEVKAKDGSERNMRFFPNSLAKNFNPVDENGNRMPKVKTGGPVAKWYQEQESVDVAMNTLKNKPIVVLAVNTYKTKDYTSGEIRSTRVYEYGWAD